MHKARMHVGDYVALRAAVAASRSPCSPGTASQWYGQGAGEIQYECKPGSPTKAKALNGTPRKPGLSLHTNPPPPPPPRRGSEPPSASEAAGRGTIAEGSGNCRPRSLFGLRVGVGFRSFDVRETLSRVSTGYPQCLKP